MMMVQGVPHDEKTYGTRLIRFLVVGDYTQLSSPIFQEAHPQFVPYYGGGRGAAGIPMLAVVGASGRPVAYVLGTLQVPSALGREG